MKTDHPGSMTTVHANDPGNAISRLRTMVGYADGDLNREVIMQQIAESLCGGLVVHAEGGTVIPRAELFAFDVEGVDDDGWVMGAWRARGIQPQHIKERMRAAGVWYDPEWFFST